MSRSREEKFEVCLKKLEEVIEKLEEGDLPLEDSLKIFEEGMALVKTCEKRLQDAQMKVRLLTRTKDGDLVEEDFEETK